MPNGPKYDRKEKFVNKKKKKNPANKGASFGEKGLVGKRDFNEREN